MSHCLPPETLCPKKNEPLVREGRAEVKVKVKKGPSSIWVHVKCQACRGTHSELSFSDESVRNVFRMVKAEAKRKTPTPPRPLDEDEPETPPRPLDEDEPECPPRPLDEDEHRLKDTFRKTCDEIAGMFQAKVDASQPTPGKKKDNSATYKKQIWLATFRDSSIFIALCPCCNIAPITRDEFQLGHIHPESRGGTDERKNVMPICAPCNNIMGTRHLYAYAWYTYGRVLWSTV